MSAIGKPESSAGPEDNGVSRIIERGRKVIRIEADALQALADRIDDSFHKAVELLHGADGKVIVTGIGKSGIVGKKIAGTFTSLGKAAYFLHPTEGAHGDLGLVMKEDIVICISKSGNTDEVSQLLPIFKRLGVPIIALTGNKESELARKSDIVLDIGIDAEACPFDMVPTASTAAAMAMGDALAIALIQLRNFRLEDYAQLHPGGSIGRKLTLRIDDLMYGGDRLAHVTKSASVKDVVFEITSKRFGATCVVTEDNKLMGIITDGDLRRLMEKQANLDEFKAIDMMSAQPIVVKTGMLASDVMNVMKIYAINQIVIVDGESHPLGMVHIHDLLKAGFS